MKNILRTKEKKTPVIVKNKKADGTSEYVVTKSPSKTIFGRIIIAVLAFSMVGVLVAGLIIALLEL